jgi:hypothetical protein
MHSIQQIVNLLLDYTYNEIPYFLITWKLKLYLNNLYSYINGFDVEYDMKFKACLLTLDGLLNSSHKFFNTHV